MNLTVSRDKIVVTDNPRTFFDDEKQKQLVASIKAVGLIQPLIVTPADEHGVHTLVAGERRLRALAELEINDVPIHVRDSNHEQHARVIENVVRADLHPIEEGRAYMALRTQGKKAKSAAALSKELGIPAARITERCKLVVLPTAVADILISGSPLDQLRDTLVEFTEAFGADVVERWVESDLEALTRYVTAPATEEDYSGEHALDLHTLFAEFLANAPDLDIVYIDDHHDPVFAAAPSEEAWSELQQRLDAGIPVPYQRSLTFSDDDLDAARAFGVLRTFKINDWTDEVYVTDRAWLWDRIQVMAEAKLKEWEGRTGYTDGRGEPVPAKPADPVKAAKEEGREPTDEEKAESQKLKDQRAAERAAEKEIRDEAGRRNQALGLAASKGLAKHKLRLSDAKLLAHMTVAENAVFGWELCVGKLDGLSDDQKRKNLVEWVTRPKTTDEVVGRLLAVFVVGAYADEQAVAMSNRKPLAYGTLAGREEFIAICKVGMPPEQYEIVAAAAADRRAIAELRELVDSHRHHNTAPYDEKLGSREHPWDPTDSEHPLYAHMLETWRPTNPLDTLAVVQTAAPDGLITSFPEGLTFDNRGNVVKIDKKHPAWVGSSFTEYTSPKPVEIDAPVPNSKQDTHTSECPACDGTGARDTDDGPAPCLACNGTGDETVAVPKLEGPVSTGITVADVAAAAPEKVAITNVADNPDQAAIDAANEALDERMAAEFNAAVAGEE